jgi:hypothetical protein
MVRIYVCDKPDMYERLQEEYKGQLTTIVGRGLTEQTAL